jgi:glycosyltransferase involved in cell wall biosynthesis
MPDSDIANIVACFAPYGGGGLGRHFSEIADARIAACERVIIFSSQPPESGVTISNRLAVRLFTYTPLRYSPGWMQCVGNSLFDRAVAARLQKPEAKTTVFTGFGGQSLRSILRARELDFDRIDLVAANSHVLNVQRLHDRALARWPIEKSWLNQHQIDRTLAEYKLADRIIVASEYTQQTLEHRGIPSSKIRRFRYTPHPRFIPPILRPPRANNVFRIVSTGSLTVVKGIPLLIEAIAALKDLSIELRLIGGTSSRGMRRYLDFSTRRDPRVTFAPGDPLPFLQRADLFVHSSFEDGFAYAPLEAMACGVPVIVTADTGMKECITSPQEGEVVPTGDHAALKNAILRRFERP